MTSTARAEPAVRARAFSLVAALLFFGSAAATLAWCGSMAAMPGMPWMRMPGQTWPGVAAGFVGMWTVMMVAMMLPVVVPDLWRYRRALAGRGVNADGPTLLFGLGYFGAWMLSGVLAFPLGVALTGAVTRLPALARAMPLAGGIGVVLAGLLQLTKWKARQLACCREPAPRALPGDIGTAWRHGLRLGLRCCYCCAPLTAVLFVAGVMDLRAMALVTAAILAERLLPGGPRVARVMGLFMAAAGTIYSIACATAGFDSNWPTL